MYVTNICRNVVFYNKLIGKFRANSLKKYVIFVENYWNFKHILRYNTLKTWIYTSFMKICITLPFFAKKIAIASVCHPFLICQYWWQAKIDTISHGISQELHSQIRKFFRLEMINFTTCKNCVVSHVNYCLGDFAH